MAKTPAWFVCWQCGCSDVQTDPANLPERCPGHDRAPIQAPELLACLSQYVGVHDCGDRLCEVSA